MPDDIENNNDQNNNQDQNNNDNQQNQDNNSLDKMIDSFIEESSNADNKSASADGTKQQGKDNKDQQQDNKGKDNQQQNARSDNQNTNQNQQDQSLPPATRKFGTLFHADQRGNIFNAKGELIAASGNPHKLFRRLWPYIEKAEVEAAGLKQQIEAINTANGAAKAANLTPQEYAAGISLITAFKRDPREAIKFLLTQAQNSGTDVSDILQGGGGLSETALRNAVKEIVTEAVRPFMEQNEQQRQHQELRQEAHQEYVAFMEEYPDATLHQGHIATMMEKSGKPMLESYFMLKTWALQNGLDWTKPLGEQAEALKARGNNNNRDPNGGNGNNHRLPDMSGRTGSDHVVNNDRKPASADEDWSAIIRSAAAEVAQSRRQ